MKPGRYSQYLYDTKNAPQTKSSKFNEGFVKINMTAMQDKSLYKSKEDNKIKELFAESCTAINKCLKPAEKSMFLKHVIEEQNFSLIAKQYGITREWARQIFERAMQKIKKQLRLQGVKVDDDEKT